MSCGIGLRPGKLLRLGYYSACVFGLILGLGIAILEDIYSWDIRTSVLLFIFILAIVGIPSEYILWTRGTYEEMIGNNI